VNVEEAWMSNARRVVVVAALASACGLSGCKSDENDPWVGAGVGAGAGALAGRSLAPRGRGTGGAVAGTVIGGVAGFAVAGGFGSSSTPEQRASPAFQQANSEFTAAQEAGRSGDRATALQHYEMATRLSPAQPEPYNNAGLLYLEQGDRLNAETMFRKAVAANPDYGPALTNLQMMGLSP
jgi:tetratricopeptide (TPR) repeat protein